MIAHVCFIPVYTLDHPFVIHPSYYNDLWKWVGSFCSCNDISYRSIESSFMSSTFSFTLDSTWVSDAFDLFVLDYLNALIKWFLLSSFCMCVSLLLWSIELVCYLLVYK